MTRFGEIVGGPVVVAGSRTDVYAAAMRRLIVIVTLIGCVAAQAEDCTHEKPCSLVFVDGARQRVAKEREMAAKMADAPVTEHNMNASDRYFDLLRRQIEVEKESFSEWCEINIRTREKLASLGTKLTSQQMFRFTGKPDSEELKSIDGMDGRLWIWSVTGPFSANVSFALTFMRKPGAPDWEFTGCIWCASGGRVTSQGCTELPWKP